MKPQPSYAERGNSIWTPPYHWFLLDHCFLFASDGEPTADLLVPAFFLVRFCTSSLDLAHCKEDWSVFDALFFALHFEVKVVYNIMYYVHLFLLLVRNITSRQRTSSFGWQMQALF